jgi:cytochrome c
LLQDSGMPAAARDVLRAKCADCHSTATRWPFYAHLAPGSWLIERDTVQARSHMDLSGWAQLSPDQRDLLEAEIVQQARSGKMPPLQYRVMHWNATLSRDDISSLSLLSGAPTSASSGALHTSVDPANGKLDFQKRCTGCHSLTSDHEGPRLGGVAGRKAGSVPGFTYSAALKNSGLVWNSANLEKWLTDPDAFVPGNNMEFHVANAQERGDIVAYLTSLSP